MEITQSDKAEIIDLILKRQLQMLSEMDTDQEYIFYLDELKNRIWESYIEGVENCDKI